MVSRIAKAVKNAVLMGALPFSGYHDYNEIAIHNDVRLIKPVALLVKMQGANQFLKGLEVF